MDNSEYVQLVLATAQTDATISEITETLVTDEITHGDATSFIEEMITGCLLVPDVEPLITGKEYHDQILKKLPENFKSNKDLENLVSIIYTLNSRKDQSRDSTTHILKDILGDSKSIFPDYLILLPQCLQHRGHY